MSNAATTLRWRERRHAAGLTIREMERRTGINRGRLSVIERGVSPSPDEAARILAVCSEAKPDE